MNRRLQVLLCALALAIGCAPADGAGGSGAGSDDHRCAGKCDDGDAVARHTADLERVAAQWPGGPPIDRIEDAFRVLVVLGEHRVVADTHLFGSAVRVIPYHNDDGVTDADGAPVERGDAALAEYFEPGDIGIAVKHHRTEHRVLDLGSTDPGDMKEHFKLQDTHIELVVGVERDGAPGVITLNNPQTYEDGRFGSPDYPMVFFRPQYPEYLGADEQHAFQDNVRTMMAGFNAVSHFPGDYNGGDPLAARDTAHVLEHVSMMVRAIAGDAEARAWFEDPENQIYCAELAHVSFSAGLHVPLNAENVVPLVGEDTWAEFERQVAAHNAGEASAFTELNENDLVRYVELTVAPDDLRPVSSYADDPERAESDGRRLAFKPMTMADIVEEFMRTHLPRETLGEELAPLQGAVLGHMKPGLLEAMAMDQLPETDPRRQAVEALFAEIVAVVSTPYGSYDEYRATLEPLLAQARAVTGPRDDSGVGLFVPPSLMHAVALGHQPGGLLHLRYVGHGLHWSMVRPAE